MSLEQLDPLLYQDLGGNVTWTVTRDLGLIAHFTVCFGLE